VGVQEAISLVKRSNEEKKIQKLETWAKGPTLMMQNKNIENMVQTVKIIFFYILNFLFISLG